MRITVLVRLYLIALIFPGIAAAQSILTVGPAGNFYISAGQLVSFDSLVLTPSTAYNFSGSNSITHNDDILDGMLQLPLHILSSYDFSNGISNYNGNLSVYYRPSELNSLLASLLKVNGYGTAWSQYSSTAGANHATATGLTNFSADEVTLGYTVNLPVTWISATARRQQRVTLVNWTTADEVNCRNYQVQRCLDGIDWSDAGPAIAAVDQPGPNPYSWTDTAALTGSVYYRIVQFDWSGAANYSVTMVVRDAATPGWTVYPNPAQNILNIDPRGAAIGAGAAPVLSALTIYDLTGRRILTVSPVPQTPYALNISGLAAGYYTLSIQYADGMTVTTGFIKR